MKKRILIVLLAIGVCVGSASAQFGGVVYDPTNYHNALLRYFQLQQQLLQLRASYTQLVAQYNFAVRMAKNIQNMPARYRAQFSQWRNTLAPNTYGNTAGWISGVNSGQAGIVSSGYRQATTQLLPYNPDQLSGMNADELARVKSQYASVELSDGASLTALATIGAHPPHPAGLEQAPRIASRTTDHPRQAATRVHRQHHQCRHPTPGLARRQHGAGDRHHHRFAAKLPHAVTLRRR